ncbi:MAG: hypothetical protein Q9M91_08205 [Candidatus Dojkabacteria bacterium]|nr:hypothetical protein [Candidatus Dojkabacteria bacterium]
MKQTIAIVGKTFSSYTSLIDRNRYKLIYLKDSSTNKSRKNNIFDLVIELDYSNRESLTKSLQSINLDFKIDVLVSIYENYVLPKAIIGEILGISALSIESAKLASNKYLMRRAFNEYDKSISPKFFKVDNLESLKKNLKRFFISSND